MKNSIKYALAFIAFSSGAVYAQKSAIDSPHNYKRPVFQQRNALAESNSIRIHSQPSHKIKNNINSVHNYKRQGRVDFTSEAALAVQMPTNPTTFNSLLSLNNYKAHFITTEFGKQTITNQTTININKTATSSSGVD